MEVREDETGSAGSHFRLPPPGRLAVQGARETFLPTLPEKSGVFAVISPRRRARKRISLLPVHLHRTEVGVARGNDLILRSKVLNKRR